MLSSTVMKLELYTMTYQINNLQNYWDKLLIALSWRTPKQDSTKESKSWHTRLSPSTLMTQKFSMFRTCQCDYSVLSIYRLKVKFTLTLTSKDTIFTWTRTKTKSFDVLTASKRKRLGAFTSFLANTCFTWLVSTNIVEKVQRKTTWWSAMTALFARRSSIDVHFSFLKTIYSSKYSLKNAGKSFILPFLINIQKCI